MPGLRRGSAPPIDVEQLERELRAFVDILLYGDYMRQHVPDGMRQIVDFAFSGNGEPTSAREFPLAIELAGQVRRETGLDPAVPLRLITNGSLVGHSPVQMGLRRLGQLGGEIWFKVDAGTREAIAASMVRICRPHRLRGTCSSARSCAGRGCRPASLPSTGRDRLTRR